MSHDQYRGSKKHVLDLVASADFVNTMNHLLGDTGISLSAADPCQPGGYEDAEEWTLRKFCRALCENWFDFQPFDQWWVPDRYTNPQWDLLSTCAIEGKKGLLMIEAKANEGELDRTGKSPPSGSAQSRKNHERIGECIAQAARALGERLDSIGIHRDTHYQLSNRVASAWKLADCGLPVALLYLGFTGDEGISDAGLPFVDHDHWQRVMGAYMDGILPLHFPDTVIRASGSGAMRLLIRSLPVLRCSPPREQDWRSQSNRKEANDESLDGPRRQMGAG